MKNHALTLFLLVTPLGVLLAQKGRQVQNYVKAIQKEVDSKITGTDLFSDTVCFVLKDKKIIVHRISDKKQNWEKVRKLFHGTDYIVNKLDSTAVIKQRRLELKNHGYVYILEVNNYDKISVVQEIVLKQPPGAPPTTF